MQPSTRLEHFFFGPQNFLSGVWHAPHAEIERVWVFCAPFGEEDKSARRTLNEGARWLAARGDAVLIFNARGAGDSRGDFSAQTLHNWREDIRSALDEAKARAPKATLGLLGVRLGASLAAQVADAEVKNLLLLEPILNGRRYWNEMAMRQKLRAKMTQKESGNSNATPQVFTASADEIFDLDGWPIGAALQADLSALNLEDARQWAAETRVDVFQIGSKSEISANLKSWCEERQIVPSAIVAQPFWNLLDHAPSEAVWSQIFAAQNLQVRGRGKYLP